MLTSSSIRIYFFKIVVNSLFNSSIAYGFVAYTSYLKKIQIKSVLVRSGDISDILLPVNVQ